MSQRVRSKTGCLTCKNRRKKCDEKRPVCERCRKAKMECLGYSHLDNPPERPQRSMMARHRTAQSVPPHYEPSGGISLAFPSPFLHSSISSSTSNSPASNLQNSTLLTDAGSFHYHTGAGGNTHPTIHNDAQGLALFHTNPISVSQNMDGSYLWADGNPVSLTDPNRWFCDTFGMPDRSLLGSSTTNPDAHPLEIENFGSHIDDQHNVSFGEGSTAFHSAHLSYLGTTSNHRSPFADTPAISFESYSGQGSNIRDSERLFANQESDNDSSSSEESDTEATQLAVYRTLALDKGLISNTLPFIVDNYAKWISLSVFDPLKLARQAKDFLFRRFERSDNTRSVTILKANVLQLFIKNPGSTTTNAPAVPLLTNHVHDSIVAINSTQPSSSLDAEEVLDTVGSIMELMYIHELSKPLSAILALIEASAPIYRRARPEPSDNFIILRACLLHPDISIRHFPAMDILFSVRTGRPMCLRYDTKDVPEPLENPPGDDETGLRWMHGIPDQFLVMLARINMLREDFGLNVARSVVSELEAQVESFKPITDALGDSLTNVIGTIIQESWRQIMFIYIFMGLDGANCSDLRVIRALKRFVRLLEIAKPSRKQDLFLMWPMIIAGVAANRRRDRDLLRHRLLSLQECSQPGTCGFDSVQIMAEIWARSDAEMRPAVWMDLRMAALKVAGI